MISGHMDKLIPKPDRNNSLFICKDKLPCRFCVGSDNQTRTTGVVEHLLSPPCPSPKGGDEFQKIAALPPPTVGPPLLFFSTYF
ncbi:hypothetical protein NPIL_412311 [Nephila pilipes]|uniref:Uncharacterized protein n=1 Tax=Nephila pilipes TaxID=299642 RepID=A0A8X6N627_NEPPI|nr:hypothetical protein NPIL_412311 [Nephila pilipes]